MTYALREAWPSALDALPAQMAARARPECSQRTGCSGLPVHDPVHGVGRPAVTECYWMSWWHTCEAIEWQGRSTFIQVHAKHSSLR
jgi:hypothetical protein